MPDSELEKRVIALEAQVKLLTDLLAGRYPHWTTATGTGAYWQFNPIYQVGQHGGQPPSGNTSA